MHILVFVFAYTQTFFHYDHQFHAHLIDNIEQLILVFLLIIQTLILILMLILITVFEQITNRHHVFLYYWNLAENCHASVESVFEHQWVVTAPIGQEVHINNGESVPVLPDCCKYQVDLSEFHCLVYICFFQLLHSLWDNVVDVEADVLVGGHVQHDYDQELGGVGHFVGQWTE